MTQRKLKKPVLYAVYVATFMIVLGCIYLLERAIVPASLQETDKPNDQKYVDKTIFDDEVPVVGSTDTILRPYINKELKVIKNFYDYQGEAQDQQNALIYHENTYLQNSGVAYGGTNEPFEVVSVLDGTVISVKEDDLLGHTIEIRHSNDIVSIYQSLSEVTVALNDEVKQGQLLGKSGNSNISTELGNHLHFELMIRGQFVNPESYYDKKLSEI